MTRPTYGPGGPIDKPPPPKGPACVSPPPARLQYLGPHPTAAAVAAALGCDVQTREDVALTNRRLALAAAAQWAIGVNGPSANRVLEVAEDFAAYLDGPDTWREPGVPGAQDPRPPLPDPSIPMRR